MIILPFIHNNISICIIISNAPLLMTILIATSTVRVQQSRVMGEPLSESIYDQ